MKTHKGHEVEVVAGDAGSIQNRGTQIKELGDQMVAAAGTLKGIKDGSLVGKGYAMDKIKDVVGEVHGDLDEAGRRYKPAGKTLSDYATVLASVQAQMRTIVTDCGTSQAALNSAEGDAEQADHALSLHNTAMAEHPSAPENAAADRTKGQNLSGAASAAHSALSTAKADHDHNLERFDTAYDTWHEAYEKAVSGLGDANKIGEDTTWENIAGVLAVISDWVGWIGLAIAVVGLIVGGPFFAIAALVVGVIALGLTFALMFDGRKDGWDLAWAVVGILPVGKLGKIFGDGKAKILSNFGSEFIGQFRNPVGQLMKLKGLEGAVTSPWRGAVANNFKAYVSNAGSVRLFGENMMGGLAERFMFGPGRSFSVAFSDAVGSSGPKFVDNLTSQLKGGLASAAKTPSFSTWEAMWNTYKWEDRAISVSKDGKPSGALSPVPLLRSLF